jgi:hypothetical protein
MDEPDDSSSNGSNTQFIQRCNCCSIDLYLTRIKLNKNAGSDDQAEVAVAIYANQLSTVFPSLATYITLDKGWGWVNINHKIGTLIFDKNCEVVLRVSGDLIEHNATGGEGAAEIGSSQTNNILKADCCGSKEPIKFEIIGRKIKPSSNNTNENCVLEVEVAAFPSNCCC